MSAEQLNVQKNEKELKGTVADKEVDHVNKLIKEIETAQKNKTKPAETNNTTTTTTKEAGKEKVATTVTTETEKDYTKEYKKNLEKEQKNEKKDQENATIETETMKAFIDNS
jgi:hypothetical protein